MAIILSKEVPTFADITQGAAFPPSFHQVTQEQAVQAVALAGLKMPPINSPAAYDSFTNAAKAWLIAGGYSADYAQLAQRSGGRNVVIFATCEATFDPMVTLIDGSVRFETLASLVKPEARVGTFLTSAFLRGDNVASAQVNLLFDPFPATSEFRSSLAEKAKVAVQRNNQPVVATVPEKFETLFTIGSISPGLVLPNLSYEVTEERGRETAELTGDYQALHDPRRWVKMNEDGSLTFDNERAIITYSGEKAGAYDIKFGEATRFDGSIAHGVLAMLPAVIGVCRLSDLAGQGMATIIRQLRMIFKREVKYGSTLTIEEQVTDIQPNNGSIIGNKLREGKVRLAVACSTENGVAIRGSCLVDVAPLA